MRHGSQSSRQCMQGWIGLFFRNSSVYYKRHVAFLIHHVQKIACRTNKKQTCREFRIQSDTSVLALHVDAPARICAKLCPSMNLGTSNERSHFDRRISRRNTSNSEFPWGSHRTTNEILSPTSGTSLHVPRIGVTYIKMHVEIRDEGIVASSQNAGLREKRRLLANFSKTIVSWGSLS